MVIDRRTIRTQAAIESGFIEVLSQKPLNKITVLELTEQINIGRGTFYSHYKDLFDLYNKIMGETTRALNRLFDANYPDNPADNYDFFANQMIAYVDEHRKLFVSLMHNDLGGKFAIQLKEMLMRKVEERQDITGTDTREHGRVSFTCSGVIGLMIDWLDDKLAISADDLSDLVAELIVNMYA